MLKENVFMCPRRLTKNRKFRRWFFSKEGELWSVLESKIIRRPNDKGYTIPNFVYENYYKKGKLATSWSLVSLAKELGYSDTGKSNVSKLIKKLESKGFLRKHVHEIKNQKVTIYELGYLENKNYSEIPYAYEEFRKNIAIEENAELFGEYK